MVLLKRDDILYESLNLLNSFPFISSPEKICAFHHKKGNNRSKSSKCLNCYKRGDFISVTIEDKPTFHSLFVPGIGPFIKSYNKYFHCYSYRWLTVVYLVIC